MPNNPLPTFSVDLIAELDERVPSGVPTPGQSSEEIWMNVGMRQLVDSLKMRLWLLLNRF